MNRLMFGTGEPPHIEISQSLSSVLIRNQKTYSRKSETMHIYWNGEPCISCSRREMVEVLNIYLTKKDTATNLDTLNSTQQFIYQLFCDANYANVDEGIYSFLPEMN